MTYLWAEPTDASDRCTSRRSHRRCALYGWHTGKHRDRHGHAWED